MGNYNCTGWTPSAAHDVYLALLDKARCEYKAQGPECDFIIVSEGEQHGEQGEPQESERLAVHGYIFASISEFVKASSKYGPGPHPVPFHIDALRHVCDLIYGSSISNLSTQKDLLEVGKLTPTEYAEILRMMDFFRTRGLMEAACFDAIEITLRSIKAGHSDALAIFDYIIQGKHAGTRAMYGPFVSSICTRLLKPVTDMCGASVWSPPLGNGMRHSHLLAMLEWYDGSGRSHLSTQLAISWLFHQETTSTVASYMEVLLKVTLQAHVAERTLDSLYAAAVGSGMPVAEACERYSKVGACVGVIRDNPEKFARAKDDTPAEIKNELTKANRVSDKSNDSCENPNMRRGKNKAVVHGNSWALAGITFGDSSDDDSNDDEPTVLDTVSGALRELKSQIRAKQEIEEVAELIVNGDYTNY